MKIKLLFYFIIFLLVFVGVAQAQPIFAEEPPHFTIILSQIRGAECCDEGSELLFEQQLATMSQLELTAHFALRYDALQEEDFTALTESYPAFEYGALLEITPALAASAGVEYSGSVNQWYEAQNIFLIGYSQPERRKLIDAYMGQFYEVFGRYPTFSAAWMIDAWSLRYLRSAYGVAVHQLTREQFGTDSYTLYGGPVHYPYWPSDNWALIPQTRNFAQPLIIRQTIMDPVFVYGDKSDSYTSQPNDYALRGDTTDYFKHLFLQAHTQPNEYTFALIGLENSMTAETHLEFFRQLQIVADWQGEGRTTARLSDFERWLKLNASETVKVYGGQAQHDQTEQAWWISTPTYRARVRLSGGELFLSDLRLYDSRFSDPYLNEEAESLGWWVVPFVLDGSRFFSDSNDSLLLKNDVLKNRSTEFGQPARITLASGVTDVNVQRAGDTFTFTADQNTAAVFEPGSIRVNQTALTTAGPAMPQPIDELMWNGQWGFRQNKQKSHIDLIPFVVDTDLPTARETFSQLLFPEVTTGVFSAGQSYVYVNNAYAIAGRNPVRLVFFPQDELGRAILLGSYPQVTADAEVEKSTLHEQHGSNGMLFIDLENSQPLKTIVRVNKEDFHEQITVYFAPDCKQKILYCLLHPRQLVWFIRSTVEDKIRAREEVMQQRELFQTQ